jgi:hypothetical protein
MDDRFWIYQNSPKLLYRQNYLQEVKSFINFVLSNPNNISADEIICSYVKCKNKKFHYKNIMMMHLLKK